MREIKISSINNEGLLSVFPLYRYPLLNRNGMNDVPTRHSGNDIPGPGHFRVEVEVDKRG